MKIRKRMLSLVLAITLVLTANISVFAASEMTSTINKTTEQRVERIVEGKIASIGKNITVKDVDIIKDFDGNDYAVVDCDPKGYFIYHVNSGVCVEYNLGAKSPFANVSGTPMYGGPANYFEKEQEKYIHTVTGLQLGKEAVAAVKEECKLQNKEFLAKPIQETKKYLDGTTNQLEVQVTRANTDYWVSNYTYFKNKTSNFGYKSGGYCGYIAANLILKYWDYRGKINLPTYSSSVGLTNELIGLGSSAATVAWDISSVMNKYCKNHSLPEKAHWAVGVFNIDGEIKNDKRPCILFGNLSNHNAGNHAVVVYGYNTYENSGYNTYVCHYGWDSKDGNTYSEVHVCGGTGSIFGSNTKYTI